MNDGSQIRKQHPAAARLHNQSVKRRPSLAGKLLLSALFWLNKVAPVAVTAEKGRLSSR